MAEKRMYAVVYSNGEMHAMKDTWVERPNHPSGSIRHVSTTDAAEAKLWNKPGEARRMGNAECTSWNDLPKGVTCKVVAVDVTINVRMNEVIEPSRKRKSP